MPPTPLGNSPPVSAEGLGGRDGATWPPHPAANRLGVCAWPRVSGRIHRTAACLVCPARRGVRARAGQVQLAVVLALFLAFEPATTLACAQGRSCSRESLEMMRCVVTRQALALVAPQPGGDRAQVPLCDRLPYECPFVTPNA